MDATNIGRAERIALFANGISNTGIDEIADLEMALYWAIARGCPNQRHFDAKLKDSALNMRQLPPLTTWQKTDPVKPGTGGVQ